MNSYIIMPEGSRWMKIDASSHEMAYRRISHWYSNIRIAIMDENKIVKTFIRKPDAEGHMIVKEI